MRDDEGVTASIPPSPRRVAAARAAGLRPRSRLWRVAGVAGVLGLVLGPAWSWAPAWLDSRLAAAMAGAQLEPPDAAAAALGLLALILGAVGARALLGHRRRGHEPGLDADLDAISSPLRLLLCVAALFAVLASLRGAPASAARSADVLLELDGAGLGLVWRAWLARTFWAVAVTCLGFGVIERLASGWRLWQGLHLTPAEARERARASTRRSP